MRVLSSIREQLKILGEKVNALEEQFKDQLFPEEPEESEAPEDLLTMLPLCAVSQLLLVMMMRKTSVTMKWLETS